jgi:hypothetical protein
VFASHEVTIAVEYEVALGRLAHLINWGALHSASEAAYDVAAEMLVRVGPFGAIPGLSKLVRVQVLEPVHRGSSTVVSLRWMATGVTADLFPALDADLIIKRHGVGRTRLDLLGSYRPPLGHTGEALDRAVLGRLAAATMRSLLENVAAVLVTPPAHIQPAAYQDPVWRPAIEPEQAG